MLRKLVFISNYEEWMKNGELFCGEGGLLKEPTSLSLLPSSILFWPSSLCPLLGSSVMSWYTGGVSRTGEIDSKSGVIFELASRGTLLALHGALLFSSM